MFIRIVTIAMLLFACQVGDNTGKMKGVGR